jgi:hypothetical protein
VKTPAITLPIKPPITVPTTGIAEPTIAPIHAPPAPAAIPATEETVFMKSFFVYYGQVISPLWNSR